MKYFFRYVYNEGLPIPHCVMRHQMGSFSADSIQLWAAFKTQDEAVDYIQRKNVNG